MLDIVSILLVLTAAFAYLSYRYTRLPTTVGVMAIALALSLVLAAVNKAGFPALKAYEESLLRSIDFSEVLMRGMLSLLLFAGALHVNLHELRAHLWQVGVLAFAGTVGSALLVGFGSHLLLSLSGIELPLAWCLLFGALISPTDPIAVLGILRSAGAPRPVETVITGEALFNDGVAIVLFILLYEMTQAGGGPSFAQAAALFAREALGGAVFGAAAGGLAFYMLKNVDDYQIEILITLATVMGGYALAGHLGVSGPLAMVVIGLVIGNKGRALAMSDTTREHLDMFWELVDAILNLILFALMGLEIALIAFPGGSWIAAPVIIALTLAARFVAVGIPVAVFRGWFGLPEGSSRILTWGALRGGISVALALSLPRGPHAEVVVMLTYSVVLFSTFVQGLSIGAVARAARRRARA